MTKYSPGDFVQFQRKGGNLGDYVQLLIVSASARGHADYGYEDIYDVMFTDVMSKVEKIREMSETQLNVWFNPCDFDRDRTFILKVK